MRVELSGLPQRSTRNLAVRLEPGALRHVRGGHPWVFDRSIVAVSADGAPGDLAVVFDAHRRFCAIGLWDPTSPIRVKILHRGEPTPIDASFWRSRLEAALERRRGLTADRHTTAYRLVHGENDGLPGLVIDRYADIGVVKLYSPAWLPHLADLTRALTGLEPFDGVVLRLARSLAPQPAIGLVDGAALAGARVDEPVMFLENGLAFEAHPRHGQKTGHFLDQRENRARVRELASGRRTLDVFSCTGGFSVHAAAGGAPEVHSVDIAPRAISTATRNMEHNRRHTGGVGHHTHTGDAFDAMTTLHEQGERFDLVIVDPPSFAPNQAAVAAATAAYARLTRLGVALTVDGGVFVQASCSSRIPADDFHRGVLRAADRAGVDLHEIERTGHPVDHPVGFPEGAYLKAMFATVHRRGRRD